MHYSSISHSIIPGKRGIPPELETTSCYLGYTKGQQKLIEESTDFDVTICAFDKNGQFPEGSISPPGFG